MVRLDCIRRWREERKLSTIPHVSLPAVQVIELLNLEEDSIGQQAFPLFISSTSALLSNLLWWDFYSIFTFGGESAVSDSKAFQGEPVTAGWASENISCTVTGLGQAEAEGAVTGAGHRAFSWVRSRNRLERALRQGGEARSLLSIDDLDSRTLRSKLTSRRTVHVCTWTTHSCQELRQRPGTEDSASGASAAGRRERWRQAWGMGWDGISGLWSYSRVEWPKGRGRPDGVFTSGWILFISYCSHL